ncbi:lytic murein transglycosylase B [Paraburkholderia sp. CNPSo 3076]|uniref:lytic murein transglycosylase B n=1 Tax=Paraburkholderia sp. CNPSo 3076 TaxID=2940936 RepID=UPI0022564D79|nr:lytic murein transglycosylase B [Paraburkholderia sp. CNPSo 3076]MCX5542163.1 lytic murein transglycosylase B [Paraburkholderia sp. CNPSo 3076]
MTLKTALSASSRPRRTTLALALCVAASLCTGAARAQTAAPKSRQTPLTLAQAQPQTPTQGQTFEEEIVPQRYVNNPDVDGFINDMVARYDFDPTALHALFASASYSATAVKLVTPSPVPGVKNWRAYQARFLDPVRINAGVSFWRANQATLQRASEEFGVPPEVIVGIIGVETIYGRYMGNFRALDALTTLAFDYPNTPNRAERMATFRKNLEDYLVWTRDAQIDPSSVLGSYTGAIGIPQFLPSSIVQYAVDYEGNNHIDLRASTADAIGSVANYLRQNGWESGRPVVWNIATDAGSLGIAQAAADGKPEPRWPLSQLLRSGLVLDQPDVDLAAEAGTPVTVIDLPSPGRGTEYKLGLKNFYVLTRYNRSFFYALAVYQLGMRVKAQMLATQPGVGVGPANGNGGNGDNGGINGGNGNGNGNGMNSAPNGTGTTPPAQQD